MRRVAFHNLGCKVNAYETEKMVRQMQERGYVPVPFEGEADIYVVNTCTVTNIADRKSRQMLHRARKTNPDALVVAVGCYVQADPEKAARDAAVDLVIGNDRKNELVELIETKLAERAGAGAADPAAAEPGEESFSEGQYGEEVPVPAGHTRAFLKIQDGCNQFCSYCLIPYVRGRVKSRPPEDVILEAKLLAARGFREIVLTGIHISSYGVDFPGAERTEEAPYGRGLEELIGRLASIPQIRRIRLGSLEPRIITEEFAEFLAGCEKICPHFHLSLQSGCGTVLKRMNRHYTPEEYREKVQLLRRVFERPAVTTDVIVGFPGETEEEFAETLAFLEQISLYETHIFKYSRRRGTRADAMPDQVPEDVKTARSHTLQELDRRNREAFRKAFSGRETEVLLEERMERDGLPGFTGTTREYLSLWLPEEAGMAEGSLVNAVVTPEMLI